MRRSRISRRLPQRVAREEGRKRIKETAVLLQKPIPGSATRKSRRGGTQGDPTARPPARRLSVEGFHAALPSPPKGVGKNAKRALLEGRTAPAALPARLMETEPRRMRAAAPSETAPHASRAGAPTRPRRVMWKGEASVVLSWKAYGRLRVGREKAELAVRNARYERKRALRTPSLEDRVVTSALLLSGAGVTAAKVPYVLAVTARYHLGFMPRRHHIATSTALDHVRTLGSCLHRQLLQQIGDTKADFCIGTDTSTRGGTLGSYIVSFVRDGAPMHRFFAFDRPASSTAVDLTASLWKIVQSVTRVGGVFTGFSSDAPTTMVGLHGGVGALLMEHTGFVRHDTCEFHASARLLAIIDSLWPPQMNVPSVSQFVYLLWYILNDDWELYRGRIVRFLNGARDLQLNALLSRFDGQTYEERREAALHKLKKPEKPNVLRWNTLADSILFAPLYMEALQFALDEERVNAGSNAPSGSIPAMCAQWIKWSGSTKLRALLSMAVEFIVDVWRPADKLIALRDMDYDVHGCFKTFSRPMRVLNLVMQIEARLGDVNLLPSFSVVLEAFGMEQVAEVEKLYKHMYSLARASVLRNSGRYLSGVHLFGGLADPSFAPVVFEAFAHWKNMPGKPMPRTANGLRLETALKESVSHVYSGTAEALQTLLGGGNWAEIRKLIATLVRDKASFVSSIVNAPEEGAFVARTLQSWRPALSHTQPVEKTFLDWDHQARGDGGTKKKATEASGKGASHVTREAKVAVSTVAHESERDVLMVSKPHKLQKRVAAFADIAAAVNLDFKRLAFSNEQLQAGQQDAVAAQDFYRQPRHGLSPAIMAVFASLEQAVEGWKAPRQPMRTLLEQGKQLEISLNTMCSAGCLKVDKRGSKKGHPGAVVTCATCLRSFHIKCMQAEGVISPDMRKEHFLRSPFSCAACDDNVEADAGRQFAEVEPPRQPPAAVEADVTPAAQPAKRHRTKQLAKRK